MGAAFKYGSPLMVDHTTATAVADGDFVVVGGRAFISHRNLAAGTTVRQAIAAPAGRGVYDLSSLTMALGTARPTRGVKLYLWLKDDGTPFVTTAASHLAGLEPDDDESVADDPEVVVTHPLIGWCVEPPVTEGQVDYGEEGTLAKGILVQHGD